MINEGANAGIKPYRLIGEILKQNDVITNGNRFIIDKSNVGEYLT